MSALPGFLQFGRGDWHLWCWHARVYGGRRCVVESSMAPVRVAVPIWLRVGDQLPF